MTLTATATQGFEYLRQTAGQEIFYLPGAVSTTYTRGDLLTISTGTNTLAAVGDSTAPIYFRCEKTVTTPGTTTPFPKPADFDASKIAGGDGDKWDTLVPVSLNVPIGAPVYLATLVNFTTDDVATYTSGTPSITLTSALGADDDANGALVYFDAGPGAGEFNMGADYANGTKILTLLRTPSATLTSSTDVAILEGEGSQVGGMSFFGRIDTSDQDGEVDVSDGYDDGNFVLFGDLRDISRYLSKGQFPVISANYLYGY